MKLTGALLLIAGLNVVSGYRSILQATATPNTAVNYNPVSITASSAPYTILATPITPVIPYSQAAYQCNVTGDSRYPPYATGTFPLTVSVPVGSKVRIVFANGNLNGATVTQQGEPGVIVQQGGAVIVQQGGGASPIVQNVGSPVIQSNAPPSALVVQQGPTVVQQQPSYPTSPVVQPVNPPPTPVTPNTPSNPTPAATTPAPKTPAPTSTPTPASTTPAPTATPTPGPTTSTPTSSATATQTPASTTTTPTSPPSPTPTPTETKKDDDKTSTTTPSNTPSSSTVAGRRRNLLQDTVPGGPNNGLVEYVGLISANTVPGFVVPNTQFGVPYLEFTASSASAGQTASFKGSLAVARVVGGVPQYPFTPNPSLSPFCQVNVNFKNA